MSNFENQFEDKYDPNTAYLWYQDPQLLNDIWTKFLVNSGTFISRPGSSGSFDDAYYLFEDYPDNNGFSENIYLSDDIDLANFFCDDDVSMALFKNPFDYISLHLEGSDTNLVTLERIQGFITAPGIGTTTIGIAVTNIGSYISCTPLAIDNVKFNVNTFDVGFVDGGSGNTNVRGDFKVNVNKFTVDAETGITSCLGDFRVNTNRFTVNATTGITSCLGDFRVNTNRFTVNATTGITSCLGDFRVNTDKFTINASTGETYIDGNVGIGVLTTTRKLEVNGNCLISGNITAGSLNVSGTKSFDIQHPTKKGYRLRYVCLEGPSADVYIRGKLIDSNVIEVPDYWSNLVDLETLNVSLTSFGIYQELYVEKIEWGKKIIIKNNLGGSISCNYVVYAERKDINKNIPEYQSLDT